MPYLKPEEKERVNAQYAEFGVKTPGELNYVFTDQIKFYIQNRGLSYQTINDIIGALEGAKQEFYRRVAVPYENKKREQNGEVYHDGSYAE